MEWEPTAHGAELAEFLGINYSTFSEWIRGGTFSVEGVETPPSRKAGRKYKLFDIVIAQLTREILRAGRSSQEARSIGDSLRTQLENLRVDHVAILCRQGIFIVKASKLQEKVRELDPAPLLILPVGLYISRAEDFLYKVWEEKGKKKKLVSKGRKKRVTA